ncbi:hypothetical protein L2E82_48437 [Cichorium intybus]|uniref:Uncharacterized protein n=1 Tax=Cichorium intybus TaxID=13427 RepID=A0ACB8YXF1_CICIN|nr:hypothetical protein L2E82_48437 [Cichorium intybus]
MMKWCGERCKWCAVDSDGCDEWSSDGEWNLKDMCGLRLYEQDEESILSIPTTRSDPPFKIPISRSQFRMVNDEEYGPTMEALA